MDAGAHCQAGHWVLHDFVVHFPWIRINRGFTQVLLYNLLIPVYLFFNSVNMIITGGRAQHQALSIQKYPHILLRKLENLIMVVAVCLHAIDLIEELSIFSSLSVAPSDASLHMVLRSK